MKLTYVPGWASRVLRYGMAVVCFLVYITQPARAATNWYVTPTGAGNQDGRSLASAFNSIQKALDVVQPGDTIFLGNGDYRESLISKRHGTANAPITIVGGADAVLRGVAGQDRVFQLNHDYYLLDGWTINGHDGDGNSAGDYRDKLLYVHGQAAPYNGTVRRGPQGLEVRNMRFLNAGGECIRLRYFVLNANIHHNVIRNCGLYDFVFKAGGKNGEGIYIGTSSNQWGDGKNPTNEPDGANNNHIHHNVIDTQGNECVEVKEGGTGNIIEYNDCTGGKDPEAAGLVSRGDGNIFRYNTTYGHAGGGLRFGGNEANGHLYGINNAAYENKIYGNALGGIKFENRPQGSICGNSLNGPNGQTQPNPAFGSYASDYANRVGAQCQAAGTPPPTPAATNTPTSTPTNTPTTVPGNPATATPTSPPTAVPGAPPTPSPTPIPQVSGPAAVIFLSTTAGGTIQDVRFKDEDILTFDPGTERWQLYFDGSDVGISSADIDALAIQPDGSLLLSFVDNTATPGLGTIDDSDIVRFLPTTLGSDTRGTFEYYFDGSDVGLSKGGEDIDALTMLADGALIVSTTGKYQVSNLSGDDEELLAFRPQRLGAETAGEWSLYFNGNDVGLEGNSDEEIYNLWIGPPSTAGVGMYVGTRGDYTMKELEGDNNDLFSCTMGGASPCSPQSFWNGDDHDFDDATMDAFALADNLVNVALVTTQNSLEDDGGAEDDVDPTGDDSSDEEEVLANQIFLPIVTKQ